MPTKCVAFWRLALNSYEYNKGIKEAESWGENDSASLTL